MFKKSLTLIIIISFFLTTLGPLPQAHADTILGLPQPGTMVNLSPAYEPAIIKGLTVHKDNPFLIDFIVDVGQDKMSGIPLKKEGERLIKYFLASLAIPDKDLWVNLSPYEKSRVIPENLGQTDMGRDLLEQDYILKQITSSLIYPEKQLGKIFWNKVYAKARQMYGTTEVPVNTFNKVWIMADRAEVLEHDQTAFVVDCHLKVMLEEDYIALQKHNTASISSYEDTHSIGANIVKEIILPELEKEINTGKNFANLRQIFNSIILSSWYKKNLKEAFLNQVYSDQSKIKGINLNDPTVKQRIYEQYLKAYKKGVFNYIKEDIDTTGIKTPRKYFSGGLSIAGTPAAKPHVEELYEHLLQFRKSFRKKTYLVLLTTGLLLGQSLISQAIPLGNQTVLADAAMNTIAGDPKGIVLGLYKKIPKSEPRISLDNINEAKAQQINQQIADAVKKLSMMINFNGNNKPKKTLPTEAKILESLVNTSVFHPELFSSNVQDKFGVGQDIPPTFVFDGNIFTTYPSKLKPYRIALTLGKDFFTVTTTYSDLPDYKNFTAWSKKGVLSPNFDPARFLVAKGGLRVYKLGNDLNGTLEDKLKGNNSKPLLLEATDLANGMNAKNPPADVFFEGGKTTFVLNQGADPQEAIKKWVTSSILAGVLGRLYYAGPDMNSADLMGILQQQADHVHAAVGLPQVPVTTSIAGEPASFDHFKWTVTSISAFESFMVVFQDEWIKKRYDIKDNVDLVIQGFGDVGSGLVQYIHDRYSDWVNNGRIRIVAVSDKNGGVYDPQGLDINELLLLREAKTNSIREDYRAQTGREIIRFENGSEVFYVRSHYPTAKFDHERSIIVFPAAGPGVFKSRDDIKNLKAAGVGMVISPANNPLKENSNLEEVFEEGPQKILFLGPSSVSFGGIYTSTKEIFNILYEGGIHRLRDKVNAWAEEWQAYIQEGIINLTMSLISKEMERFKKDIDANRMTTFFKIHIELAAQIRRYKNDILGDPSTPFLNNIDREVKAVFNQYKNDGEILTQDHKDVIAQVIILNRVIEEARARAMYDMRNTSLTDSKLKILDQMLQFGPNSIPQNQQLITIYELGKMGVIDVRKRLSRIIVDVRFNDTVKSTAAAALANVGNKYDETILRQVAEMTNISPSLRFWTNWAADRIKKTSADEAMAADKVVISRQVLEPANLYGGIDLNTSNGMQWKINRDGKGVEMNVDPAMIERAKREGVDTLSPVIFKITPVVSVWPLVGLKFPVKEEQQLAAIS